MIGDENTPATSKFTPPQDWTREQVDEVNQCCAALSKGGMPDCQIAMLIYGEQVIDMECVKPKTIELFHKLMLDLANQKDEKDDLCQKLYTMMVEESSMLFTHALDEDIAAWNRSRSDC